MNKILSNIEKLRVALNHGDRDVRMGGCQDYRLLPNKVIYTTWDEHPHSGNVSDVETFVNEKIPVQVLKEIYKELEDQYIYQCEQEEKKRYLLKIGI